MKKQFLILAGAAMIFASCGENKTEDSGQTQAQIDSAVNAQLAAHAAEEARIQDSTMKAVEAQRVADSIAAAEEAAKKGGGAKKPKTPKATPAPTPPPPPPPPPPPAGGLRGRSDQAQEGTQGTPSSGGGLRKRSDQNQK